jgi:uncharacterized tellurite resistance protein B-like protein
MARKKKSAGGGLGIVAVLLAIGALASIPKEAWFVFGAVLVVGFIVYAFGKSKGDSSTRQPPSKRPGAQRSSSGGLGPERTEGLHRRAVSADEAQPTPLRFSTATTPQSGSPVTAAATIPLAPEAAPAPSATASPPPAPTPTSAPAAARASETVPVAAPGTARVSPPTPASVPAIPVEDEPTRITFPDAPAKEFRIPTAPNIFGPGRWLCHGEEVEVRGLRIPGGLLYVGTTLKTPGGGNDPSLIDPGKAVAAHGNYTERQMGYWPSYSEISTEARRSYLEWLADGKRDPAADIGFVFLYFYGLERRAIIDALKDPEAKKEWPLIAAELRRLLGIYGQKSGSFRGYAGSLLNLVQISEDKGKLYEQPVPEFPKSYELPLYVKLALGQCAVDGVPVPPHLALAWVRFSPDIYLRTPATRCPEEFEKLFTQKYKEALGGGLTLPRNKTRLRLVHNPASAGFRGLGEISLSIEGIPDVTVLTGPVKKLVPIVEDATKELDSFSRFVGKNPDARASFEALLQLPPALWPASAQATVESLKARMGSGMLTLSLKEVLEALDSRTAPNNERIRSLARTLEAVSVGMEPDVLGGAKVPKTDEPIVLFHFPPGEPTSRSTPAYQAAVLTLQLSASVAAADGDFGAAEIGHLRHHIESWTHLTPNHHRRLLAHLRLMMKAPVSLASLKKKLEPLEQSARETIAAFMATVAQVDGTVTPAELKALEKVYKALGVDARKVFSDVHAVGAVGTNLPARAQPTRSTASAGFTLDTERIAALQRDSEKVSVLLSNIFREEEVVEATTELQDSNEPEDASPKPEGLLGLDEPHTAFARLLLTRQSWTRAELLDAAADLELMLDGALEQLNEAAFDRFDTAFTEGDDPVEINHDVLEQIAA